MTWRFVFERYALSSELKKHIAYAAAGDVWNAHG